MKIKANENSLEKSVYKRAIKEGWCCFKFTPDGKKGYPDRLFYWPVKTGFAKHFAFVELKRKYKEPTALQLLRISELKAQGIHASWADNIEDVFCFLDTIKKLY